MGREMALGGGRVTAVSAMVGVLDARGLAPMGQLE